MMGEWRPSREMKVGREVQAEGSKCDTFIGWKRFKACKKWGVGGKSGRVVGTADEDMIVERLECFQVRELTELAVGEK